jgi:hypothetical protein
MVHADPQSVIGADRGAHVFDGQEGHGWTVKHPAIGGVAAKAEGILPPEQPLGSSARFAQLLEPAWPN